MGQVDQGSCNRETEYLNLPHALLERLSDPNGALDVVVETMSAGAQGIQRSESTEWEVEKLRREERADPELGRLLQFYSKGIKQPYAKYRKDSRTVKD